MDNNASSTPSHMSPSTDQSCRQNPRKRSDIAWKHCYEVQTSGKKRTLKCLYCDQIICGGGINRMKQHLAGMTGNVKPCPKVNPEVRFMIKGQLIEASNSKKEKSDSRMNLYDVETCELDEDDVVEISNLAGKGDVGGSSKKKKTNEIRSYMKAGAGIDSAQPSIQATLLSRERWHDTEMSIALWFYDSCIPINAVNSPFFQPMISRIATMGHGYTGPTYHALRAPLLKEAKTQCQLSIDALRSKWVETGFTIMGDGWTDGTHRSLNNFLVYCPNGISFIKFVDASVIDSDAQTLCNLFSEIVEMVGAKNVVHMVTDNAKNYKKARKLLSEKYPSIYWSTCSAHCINLIMKDIGECIWVKNLVILASRITMFVYNHKWPHGWLRKRPGWTEIICPGDTRFGTQFIALKSLYDHKEHLEAIVVNVEFKKFLKTEKGREVKQFVLDSNFWNNSLIIVKIMGPIMRLLCICDSDEKPSLGYVYEGMWRTIKGIKELFRNKEHLYKTYIDIIDDRWDKMLRKRLHAAAFFLNPAFQYDPDSPAQNPKAFSGLLDVVEKYFPELQNIVEEITTFRERQKGFGRSLAINNAKTTQPDEWWRCFGHDVPHLQQIAVKILSQTSSSSGCERNWSVFERIHTKRRNRLEHQRLNDLVFVHYNLRLQHRGKQMKRPYDPIDYESIDKVKFWVVDEDSSGELDVDEIEDMLKEELSYENLQLSRGDEEDTNRINDHIDLTTFVAETSSSNDGEVARILRQQRNHFIDEDDNF